MSKIKQKQNLSIGIVISAFVVGIAIIIINIIRIVEKLETTGASSLWQEIALIIVAILLVIRVFYMYKKQK
ncbi:MAG: hypothetical protein Q7I99_05330 [Acholeplasmataceae bacterium]|nr:hypothetical protein [Acholeplasmataceae bacterium]